MTREESEKYIKSKMCSDCGVHLGGGKCSDNCKVIEAVKTLEQESVLDKIRAEINWMHRVILKSTPKDDWAVRWNDCIDDVLKIIDKYKAESEG